jgi:hypothetical protein
MIKYGCISTSPKVEYQSFVEVCFELTALETLKDVHFNFFGQFLLDMSDNELPGK